MFSVALTGNAAAGKSTVAHWFREWGATLIDADQLVREVQQPGSPVLAKIAQRFGTGVLLPDGNLDRARLRRLILADPAKREALNAIVHPAVQARAQVLLRDAQARGDRIVVHDIPLLFEVLDPGAFDLVVLVDAPEAVRRARLLDRGLSAEEIDQLCAAQLKAGEKRAKSHLVLDNAGPLNDLRRAARQAWQTISARAASA
jgi:dephospho-CoA kinase